MTTNWFRISESAPWALATLLLTFGPWGCSPKESVSGATNWVRCDSDTDCRPDAGEVCGAEGYCVDSKGEPLSASGGQVGAGGAVSGAGGKASSGGANSGGTSSESSGGAAGAGPVTTGGMGGDASDLPCEQRDPANCEVTPHCLPLGGTRTKPDVCPEEREQVMVACLPEDTVCTQSTKFAVSPTGECFLFGSCVPGSFRAPEAGECEAQSPCSTSEVPLDQLNQSCDADDQCPSGLTPTHFYGIAGTSGPLFCSCSIPCAEKGAKCPEGSSCATISDGPGQVCVAN